jgi:hypothetical protein
VWIEGDVPARDVSVDVARAAWDAFAARCDVLETRAPDFIQRFLPDFDLLLAQAQSDVLDERAHARNLRASHAAA